MFSQYFGNYLLNQGLLTREQLTDALEYQSSVHVKFGVIAVDEGILTPEQVEKIHEMQKQVDKRFGEIAVDMEYLTDEQVEAMLSVQKQSHLLLAQALVDRDYMSIEQFSNALNTYKNSYSLSDEKFDAVKQGDIDVLVQQILEGKADTKIEKYGKYLSLFAKNMIRFIDDQVFLDVSEKNESTDGDWLVHQEIIGEAPLFTAISANEDVFLKLASVYAEEELSEVDELAQASVSEFLNLHNGIYLVNMSNEGIELKMNPQEVIQDASLKGDLLIVTVHTSKGDFKLALTDQPSKIKIESTKESQQLI
jgi:CheY-specific phosphatase CheX